MKYTKPIKIKVKLILKSSLIDFKSMKKLILFFFLLCANVTFAQIPRTSNLVGSYQFNSNANDTSGSVNNGTAYGSPTLIADRFNNADSAYSFDGNDYFYFGNSMASQINNIFSISLWLNQTSTSPTDLIGLGYQTCNGSAGPIIRAGSTMNFNRCNAGFDTPDNTSNDGNWHQFVFVYDGSSRKVYRDGTLLNNLNGGGIFTVNTYGLVLGKAWNNYSGGNFYQGKADDLNIWNVALTANEVQQLYNYENQPLSGVGYINYHSYKTNYGNGTSSTYNGVTYSGHPDSYTEFNALVDVNQPGTTLYSSGEVSPFGGAGLNGGHPDQWSGNYFAIEYTGWFKPDETGTYYIRTLADDASETMYRESSSDSWTTMTSQYGCCSYVSGTATLDEDTWYEFKIRYEEMGGGDYYYFEYSLPQNASNPIYNRISTTHTFGTWTNIDPANLNQDPTDIALSSSSVEENVASWNYCRGIYHDRCRIVEIHIPTPSVQAGTGAYR